ncbi:MAG: OmpA family protein [Saccharospirillum sp.]|uniref:OmpA family protein n=1 Tax=Saccharospirillum sp. TaxID=2033801 RepID=UPI0034A03646
MTILTTHAIKRGSKISGLVLSLLLVAACSSTPVSPEGSAQVRNKLTALQNDSNLASQIRAELREAEEAVQIAEQPLPEDEAALGEHRVYIAENKVAIAEAKATARFAEVQRALLSEEREAARLQARTQEANQARLEAERARSDADAAQQSRAQAETLAAQQAAEYQRQIDALEAEPTDRGLVLTLGDVLFATGSAEIRGGASTNLNRLVSFLQQYPERKVQIEGHTDNVGSSQINQVLSRQRAESVRNYLIQQGIASNRITAMGLSMNQPIASNDTAEGRQQNRRVEIIIDEPS